MNDGLTESERALNCIIENYINELQRNTCDDNEEDMRIYKEKTELIESQKEIVLKDLEVLGIFKEQLHISVYKAYFNGNPMHLLKIMGCDIFITKEIYDKLKAWLDA